MGGAGGDPYDNHRLQYGKSTLTSWAGWRSGRAGGTAVSTPARMGLSYDASPASATSKCICL